MGVHRQHLLCGAALVAALLAWRPHGAHAEDAATAEASEAEGRARFEAGRAAFASGRFEEALADFQRAYQLTQRPVLLFNVATAADRLRRDELALRSFEAYLAALPEADNRDEVEGRMRVLRAQQRARDEAPSAPAPEPARAPPDPAAATFPRWIVPSAGALVAAGGGVLLGLGVHDKKRVEDAPRDTLWADVRDSHDQAPARIAAGAALLGVGVATVLVGLVWPRARERRASLAFDGRRLCLGGSF